MPGPPAAHESSYLCLVLASFKKQLRVNQWLQPGHRLLLAISGGADSVVLAHLLRKSGLQFSLAHGNFNLRGRDSQADEAFCRKLATQLGVKIFVTQLDAADFSKKNKVSIQMAARQLRYAWFEELMNAQELDYLLTAHHADDVVETLIINLLRGTGVKGLKGIPEKTGRTVRPLLNFTKTEILKYAAAEGIPYRTDKSNLEPKYERNFIRLKVMPLLKELHPALDRVMLNNVRNFREEAELVQEGLAKRAKKIQEHKKGFVYLDKVRLVKDPYCRSLLHYLLSPCGFNASQLEDVEENIRRKGLVGKIIKTATHILTIDRRHLVIKENTGSGFTPIAIKNIKELGKVDFLGLTRLRSFKMPAAHELVVQHSRLIFPLSIRSIARGDRFKPFGMKGFKLLSDFLKDQKLNNFDKETCKLLVNGNGDIIWVLGYRSDERYKVDITGKDLIKLSLLG